MDLETRRRKRQALIVKMVERKVRSRAEQLYQTRGEVEGHALQDWFQAESEVLENTVVAPLYRRLHSESQGAEQVKPSDLTPHDSSPCETSA